MVKTAELSDCNYLSKNAYKIKLLDIFHFQNLFCPISMEIQLTILSFSKQTKASMMSSF